MPKLLLNTGVYQIRNIVTGKVYVGSASGSLTKRLKYHVKQLDDGSHCNRHLLAAWKKYGKDNFTFTILERCAPDECVGREQYWLDLLEAANPEKGYNISPTAGSIKGVKMADSVKARLSDIRRNLPDDVKARVSAAVAEQNRNRVYTDELRAKYRARGNRKGGVKHGQDNGNSKLSADQVVEIRSKFKEWWVGSKKRNNAKQLAAEYGVGPTAIREIAAGTKWNFGKPPQEWVAVAAIPPTD